MKLKAVLRSESLGGVMLIGCVVLSLLIANANRGAGFEKLLGLHIGPGSVKLTVLEWINDGLMAIFFFFVGLEIKHEILDGHLSTFKKAVVPVFAALGGALLPALIFALLNGGTSTAKGWGIPMATDIAFALGVLSLLGRQVPPVLKAFLSTLAVADDLLAILVIAIFYAGDIRWSYLLPGFGVFVLLLSLNKLRITQIIFYIIPGIILWYCLLHSGVHATIAGVLTAFAIPNHPQKGSTLKQLAFRLAKPVNLVIMPLFAIANTNILLSQKMLGGLTARLSTGIIAGLIIGKPGGIMLISWLSVKLRVGVLPNGLNWKLLAGLGMLAGIGFTMSIFISVLSFGHSAINSQARLAILAASIGSGLLGYGYLRKQLKQHHRQAGETLK